jgi:hypothetical protein
LRPAAVIRPFWTTTVPPSIGSEPSPSATVPPVMAMVWAKAGAARSASAHAVIPAKAGIHERRRAKPRRTVFMDSGSSPE